MLSLTSSFNRAAICSRSFVLPKAFTRTAATSNKMTSSSAQIKVGDAVPAITVFENTPGNKINFAELVGSGKSIVFGVPGAFTPGCSKTHLPGYVTDFDKFKAKGISNIICVAVNDPFVMEAWGKAQGADGKVRMIADTGAHLAKAMGLDVDLTAGLGNIRMRRFSMLVEDGKVKVLNVEPDGVPMACSLSNNLLSAL